MDWELVVALVLGSLALLCLPLSFFSVRKQRKEQLELCTDEARRLYCSQCGKLSMYSSGKIESEDALINYARDYKGPYYCALTNFHCMLCGAVDTYWLDTAGGFFFRENIAPKDD